MPGQILIVNFSLPPPPIFPDKLGVTSTSPFLIIGARLIVY